MVSPVNHLKRLGAVWRSRTYLEEAMHQLVEDIQAHAASGSLPQPGQLDTVIHQQVLSSDECEESNIFQLAKPIPVEYRIDERMAVERVYIVRIVDVRCVIALKPRPCIVLIFYWIAIFLAFAKLLVFVFGNNLLKRLSFEKGLGRLVIDQYDC